MYKNAGRAPGKVECFAKTNYWITTPETLPAMREALEKAGVKFTDGKRPGVRVATYADVPPLKSRSLIDW